MGDVEEWLERLGLSRYRAVFAEHDIDREILPDLTDQDLEKLGLSLGHRKKLLRAIAELNREDRGAERKADATPRGAERRQLTVLFCDLVGSTALAARLDPEDLRDVMRAYQAACGEVIGRFEGHVTKYLGDGVLAYFGWPQAHEDDAERAVRAGLQLVETIAGLHAHADVRLQARIGIATGQAVVGDLVGEGASREEAVVGEVPNLAARLQALAAPGSVVIGQATRRLVGGLFELDDLGPQRLKGFAEPLAAFRVAGEGRAEGRFEARQTAGMTPLVGRDEELALLQRRWRQASEGEGQVVLLSGEPGIGKSRLVRELHERLESEPHVRLLYQCSPHHATSPLHPVIAQLERAAEFAREDPSDARLAKLEALLARGTRRLDQAVPRIAALLGIPTGERYPLPELTPQRQKQLTLEALVEQLEGLAATRPVLLAYEDVHWIDPTTQELLGLIIERIQHLPVLLLTTFRPEFTPPWPAQPHVSALALSRLGRREGAAMVDRLAGAKALPDEIARQIVAKTDGVPLFVEELTKTVLESGLLADAGDHYELSGPLPPLAIPATLRDSLLARLDRLAPVKEIAQIGAALGREFPHALLAAVADRPESELLSALDQLMGAELIYRRGTPPEVTYTFKHALVQDAAYGTLLKSKRQHLHARIVDVLEERFPETGETQPDLLAHHCTQAGLIEKSVDYWHRAGQRAVARSAMAEAVAQLTSALELLVKLPENAARQMKELDLQVLLGGALFGARGWATPEGDRAFARARELCGQLGDPPQLFTVLFGKWSFLLERGELSASREVAEELLRLTDQPYDVFIRAIRHRAIAVSSQFLGQLASARSHHEEVIALSAALRGRAPAAYGQYPHVVSLSFLAAVRLYEGYSDQAVAWHVKALAEAHKTAHPFTLAFALFLGSVFRQVLGDVQRVEKLSTSLVALAAENGFSNLLAPGRIIQSWALAKQGDTGTPLTRMRKGLAALRATGAELKVPYYLALIAEVERKAGRASRALGLLMEALERVDITGERWFEADLLRLRGEALVALSPERGAEAESRYQQALAVARDQGARLWELRAATSLARLWRDQGRRAEAYDLLAPVYGWFTEGFDTADLKEAKTLLDELA